MGKKLNIHLRSVWGRSVMAFVFLMLLVSPFQGSAALAKSGKSSQQAVSTRVFASGLDNPRGLKFGPDGYLYVAEGGQGGSNSTIGQCEQVVAPVGPYTGGMTARISKISPSGERTTVVDHLPSSQTSPALGSLISGVADVAFVKGDLYALLAGAGCSHGIPDVPNGVIRVNQNGSWTMLADLSAFLQANPVQNPEEEDFEPDGTWYSMIAANNALFAVEPNHGELDRITTKGMVSRIVDISASQGHIVPTSVDYFRGSFFVGNLTTFPLVQGAAKIMQINKGGHIKAMLGGLTNIVSAIFDADGNLYILESTTGNPMPTPDTGIVEKVTLSGQREILASGLSLPTAMTFGPDGALYVSNKGFGYPPGMGEVVRISFGD
jgi:hypothetical protein